MKFYVRGSRFFLKKSFRSVCVAHLAFKLNIVYLYLLRIKL